MPLLSRSKQIFLTYFIKDCTKKVLKIYKSIVTENFKLPLCPIKWRPFKAFVKLHKCTLLIDNIIVKGAVSGLRQFLVSETPGKSMKNSQNI